MTTLVRYLTHPQVQIDPHVPVQSWHLSVIGAARVQALIAAGWLAGTTVVVSSAEQKALETAEPLAAALGVPLETRAEMHENDRSATGFLGSVEFASVANEFFTHPHQSIRGWERAVDAQVRIVREAEAVLSRQHEGDVLFVGHGAVGTLLLCHYSNVPISSTRDQRSGGGCYFTMTKANRKVLHFWRRMEDRFEVCR